MKIAEIAYFNPKAGAQIGKLPFINYIDTAAVVDGVLEGVQELQKDYPSRAQRELRNGDILISSVRPNLKHNYFVDIAYDNMVGSTGFIQIRPNNPDIVDAKFLYYFLTAPFNVARYVKIADTSQSAYPSFNKDVIEEMDLPGVDITKQRKIGSLLSTIDRKIALIRKCIATLEAMAKEIYDYWFVQFDFPDAHGRPYKSSGGAMVYNPDLKREIPKGWEVKSVNDCGVFFRGVGYSKADERARGTNTVLVMRGNNISNGRIVDDSDRVFIDKSLVSAEQLMDRFSVLFAMSSGSKEHVGKAAVYYDYPANAAFGAFCSKYVPQLHYRYMMFCFLVSETYRAFVKRICGGTGINNMKPEYFDVPLFAVPRDEALLHKFNDMAEQAYSQIYNCTQEISKLIGLRDFLLPVLMNGQVKVG